jgi:hypothetical protein
MSSPLLHPPLSGRDVSGSINARNAGYVGLITEGCLQEIDQFLEVDPIADIQEAVGPVEVQMLPACRVRSLGRVGPLVILPTRPRARAAFNPASVRFCDDIALELGLLQFPAKR